MQERRAMKLFTGSVMAAGLVLTAATANAQPLAPYEIGEPPYAVVSDIDGPYAGMPPEAPAPRYYGPILLPPREIYAIVRHSGFSPLGIPQQRGLVYIMAVIDRGGDDGRLVIDARSGRIIRFMPAYRMGDNPNEDLRMTYGAVGRLPPVTAVRGPPRPPLSIPRLASRTPYVPMPPRRAGELPPGRAGEAKPLAAKPATAQSAAVQAKPVDTETAPQAAAPAVPQAAAPVVEAKPSTPEMRPTQEMPKVQGLE
jgi:hypothetical protein